MLVLVQLMPKLVAPTWLPPRSTLDLTICSLLATVGELGARRIA